MRNKRDDCRYFTVRIKSSTFQEVEKAVRELRKRPIEIGEKRINRNMFIIKAIERALVEITL